MNNLDCERGSIAPLGLGLFLVSATLLVTIAVASSLFTFQKRLTNLAESAALYVASTGQTAAEYLRLAGSSKFIQVRAVDRQLSDGLTVQVMACARWDAPLDVFASFTSREICSYANARIE